MSGAVRLRDVTEADLPVLFENGSIPKRCAWRKFPSRDRSIRVLEMCGFTAAGEDVAGGVEELMMKLG